MGGFPAADKSNRPEQTLVSPPQGYPATLRIPESCPSKRQTRSPKSLAAWSSPGRTADARIKILSLSVQLPPSDNADTVLVMECRSYGRSGKNYCGPERAIQNGLSR